MPHCGKVCHLSRYAALRELARLYYAGRCNILGMRVYLCLDCQAYHLGHSRRAPSRRERERWPYTLSQANPN